MIDKSIDALRQARESRSSHDDELVPDWSMHPGQMLAEILEARDIRQSELAERTGMSPKHVNQLVTRAIGITGDTALALARALDTPAEFWLKAQTDWEFSISRQRDSDAFDSYAAWATGFDRASLEHHAVCSHQDGPREVVEKLLRFFGVSSPAAFEETWMRPRVSFRRAQRFPVREKNTALWLRLVDQAAAERHSVDLNPRALRLAATELPGLTRLPLAEGFIAARQVLAEVGVALVFVPEIHGTRICGATWWLDARHPVIAVTERYRKVDSFWFNIAHEVGHVVRHPKRETFLNIDRDQSENDGAEEQANEFARELLIGNSLNEITTLRTREDFVRVARRLGVGVTIVAGQYVNATSSYGGVAGKLRMSVSSADVADLEEISASE